MRQLILLKALCARITKKSENLVTQPIHGRKTLLNKIKERANYLVNDYMSIDSKLNKIKERANYLVNDYMSIDSKIMFSTVKRKACNTIEHVILKLLTKDILTKKKRSLTKRLQSRMKHPIYMKMTIVSLVQKLNHL